MDQLVQLLAVTRTAQQQQDLPDYIARRVEMLIATLEGRSAPQIPLAQLIDQINDYDTYGQTGYLGMGVNHVILSATLDRIFAELQTTYPGSIGG